MASTGNQQQPFPAVPPSFSAGDLEMRDYYAGQDAPRPAENQTPYLRPYLGLRARLSQVWINRWTVLIILVLVRLLFAITGVNESLGSARRQALSACTQVENIGSSMASMPYYMSQGVNEMTASGVEKAVSALVAMLDLTVTGVEEIVLFVIHMMTNTYLCLITLAVTGSLHAAVELGNQIAQHLNQTIDEVTDKLGGAVKNVEEGINSLVGHLNGIPVLGDTPSINLDDEINKLKNLEVPPELTKELQDLNSSIPTFEDVQNFTDSVIRFPFEKVKELIHGMDNFTFDRSLLPVPEKEKLNFCSEGNSINDFFDNLVTMEITARKIGLAVLIILAILACVPMAWTEIRRYRRMQEHSRLFAHGHEPMEVIYIASRPHSGSWGVWLGDRFGSGSRRAAVRWAWAYATSVPMLFLLSLGIAGLFSCFCQYLLLRGIQSKVPELTNQVADFAEKVVNSLNNASMSWSDGVNGAIGTLDSKINGDMLEWVNTTTFAINETLNGFVEKTSEVLNTTFGGTILHDPIKEVLNCLIGLKIASFQSGLTWVSEHAHVSFPGVANDTFSLGALSKVSNSSSAAELLADPNGKAQDEITETVDYIVQKLLSGIRQEALIATALIVLWLLAAIGGSIYACTQIRRRRNLYPAVGPYNIAPDAGLHAPKPAQEPLDAAPPYEYANDKVASSTLPPRQFATYGPNDNEQSEKVGHVDAHPVAEAAQPGHVRKSSHGHLAQPSPLDEVPRNPFNEPIDEKRRNPFIDPTDEKRCPY